MISPRATFLHPATALSLALVAPWAALARFRLDVLLLLLAWVGFCRWMHARWWGGGSASAGATRPGGRARGQAHLAEALLVFLGGLVVVFAAAWITHGSLLFLVAPLLIADAAARRLGPRVSRVLAFSPLLTVLVCLALTFGGYQAVAPRVALPDVNDDFLYVLRANRTPAPLSDEERSAAISLARAGLLEQDASGLPRPGRLALPYPERVWVTAFRPTSRDRWTRGHGDEGTLADRLVAAGVAARAATRGKNWSAALPGSKLAIDLEGPGQVLRARAARRGILLLAQAITGRKDRWMLELYDLEAGVDGMRLQRGDQEATVLPADSVYDGWFTPREKKTRYRSANWSRTLQELQKRSKLPGDAPWPAGATLTNFSTYSFAQPDPAAPRTVELYRGNVLFQGDLDEARLLAGLSEAGEWLLRTVEADGRFDYEYYPHKDDHGRDYNEVRHAGSVYGLFHLGNLALREPTLAPRRLPYIEAGVKALDRVYRSLGTPPGVGPQEGFVAFLEGTDGDRTNSGAQALTLLSFLERPAPDTVDDAALAAALQREGDAQVMAGLAKTLMAMVDERGWVHNRWRDARGGEPMKRQPLYYPGELLLALVLYAERTGDAEALAVSKRVGHAQIAYTRRPFEIPDHWVMQALDRLDALDPQEPAWRDAAYWMGHDYIDEQFPPQLPHAPDYRGAYRRTLELPRTTRAASRGEAIGGVARIAWRRGDPSEAWEVSLIEGARHLIEQMYTPDNSYFLPVPEEARGAIRMGPIDNHCRIDNNQHGVVALNNALEALRRRAAR